jgi:hypothetical protein
MAIRGRKMCGGIGIGMWIVYGKNKTKIEKAKGIDNRKHAID